jgi:hypothetical protein
MSERSEINHMQPEQDLYAAWQASMEQPGQGLQNLMERAHPELRLTPDENDPRTTIDQKNQ